LGIFFVISCSPACLVTVRKAIIQGISNLLAYFKLTLIGIQENENSRARVYEISGVAVNPDEEV